MFGSSRGSGAIKPAQSIEDASIAFGEPAEALALLKPGGCRPLEAVVRYERYGSYRSALRG